MKAPTRDELIALTAREAAKREAYLRRRFTPAERWRIQQEALAALARLRPDLDRRLPHPTQTDAPVTT